MGWNLRIDDQGAIVTDGSGSLASGRGKSSAASVADEVSEVIVGCIAEFGEADRSEIERSSLLETLDIDSLDLVEIAQVLEERFGIVIEPDHMKDVATVGDAIDAVVALLPE
jgi:acyl carrier protein